MPNPDKGKGRRKKTMTKTSEIYLERISSVNRLKQISAQWKALAVHAIETNLFFEDWFLTPAFSHLQTGHTDVVVAWNNDAYDAPILIALLPIQKLKKFKGLPIDAISTWSHAYCYLGTPLLHRDFIKEAVAAITSVTDIYHAKALSLEQIPNNSNIASILNNTKHHGYRTMKSIPCARAVLNTSLNSEHYFLTTLSKKKRKEYGRLKRRLMEQGDYQFEKLSFDEHSTEKYSTEEHSTEKHSQEKISFDHQDLATPNEHKKILEPWLNDFLNIENSGWKKQRGTAIAQNEVHIRFFKEIAHNAAAEKKLLLYRIKLGNKTLSSLVIFLSGNQAITFKICFDETFKKYSPGVLLMLETTQDLLDHHPGMSIDSGASQDHKMINHLWKDKLHLFTAEISTRKLISKFLFRGIDFNKKLRSRKIL